MIFPARAIVADARVTLSERTAETYDAERGEQALNRLFETDDGAKRLGEFGVKTDCKIIQPTTTRCSTKR